MLRSSLIAAGALLFCSAASAQQLAQFQAFRGQIKNAGTFDKRTGTWTRAGNQDQQQAVNIEKIYNNTCFWTGNPPATVFFTAQAACVDIYDEGRIENVMGGPLRDNDNVIASLDIAYVTFAPPGAVDLEYTFYNNLGGDCAGFAAPTPPEPASAGQLRLNVANGITLPGDAGGTGTAWLLTVILDQDEQFCLISEGDGTAGNGDDQFNWRFRHYNPGPLAMVSGPVIAGEPITATFGTCTYSMTGALACGSDPIIGTCGTGLGTFDAFWRNVAGDLPNGAPNTSPTCGMAVAGVGGGCFFFGGHPGNPYASFFLGLDSAGPCTVPAPVTYCTAKTTSHGCLPFMGSTGTASASSGAFNVNSDNHVEGQIGVYLYSTAKGNLNFHGGKLCVKAPFTRLSSLIKQTDNINCVGCAGGGPNCRMFKRNFNQLIQDPACPQPLFTIGARINTQVRQRDPTNTIGGFADNLSNGISWVIGP